MEPSASSPDEGSASYNGQAALERQVAVDEAKSLFFHRDSISGLQFPYENGVLKQRFV